MPPRQGDHNFNGSVGVGCWSSTRHDNLVPAAAAAATLQYGRSPTKLIKSTISSSSSSKSSSHSSTSFLLSLPKSQQRFIGRLLALIVPSLFYIGPALLSLPMLLVFLRQFYAAFYVAILNLILCYYPVKPWPAFRHVFQLWYDLYDLHHNMILEEESTDDNNKTGLSDNQKMLSPKFLEDKALIIYATHPHGIIPIHGYLWCAFCDQNFPKRYGFGAVTSIVLRLPLLRHVMGWLSVTPATKSVLMERLDSGENLYILPGGVQEIFMACPGSHVIKTPRRGLMKLALQTGACLVPTYVFGANECFNQLATYEFGKDNGKQHQEDKRLDSPSSSSSSLTTVSSASSSSTTTSLDPITKNTTKTTTRKSLNSIGMIQRKISRFCQGGFTFFWGQYMLPLPYEAPQCKISMVFGNPIESVPGTLHKGSNDEKWTCQQISNPTEKQIDDLHQRYTDSLIKLFEQYKIQAGCPPNTKLTFE